MKKEDLFRTLWESIRNYFLGRRLTKTSDMPPAMAGLAQMLEKIFFDVADHKYLAELWSMRILEVLSWTVQGFEAATKSVEGIPTWSWASTTAPSDYIYGKPSETFVDLAEAHCTGYARPKETTASLKVKGFTASLFLRLDHRHKGSEDRPSLSFWANENSAMIATTEENGIGKRASRTTSVFVSDMSICPAWHDHEVMERRTNRVYVEFLPSCEPQKDRGNVLCAWKRATLAQYSSFS